MADKMNTDYWNKFYGGGMNPSVPFVPEPGSLGYSSGPTFQPGMMGRGISSVGSPNLTAAEQQLLNQQIQQSQALQAGYNPDGTPKPVPATPSVGVPAPAATWNRIDQAGYDAANKPGTWLATSRMNAQALMRQMAALQGGMPMAPGAEPAAAPAAVPGRSGGLASLITGYGTPRASSPGGLVGMLLGGGATPAPAKTGPTGVGINGYTYVNGQNMGYAPTELAKREAQGKAIAAANKKNPNPTKTVTGDNNAFMPKSVQESVRWQTGY